MIPYIVLKNNIWIWDSKLICTTNCTSDTIYMFADETISILYCKTYDKPFESEDFKYWSKSESTYYLSKQQILAGKIRKINGSCDCCKNKIGTSIVKMDSFNLYLCDNCLSTINKISKICTYDRANCAYTNNITPHKSKTVDAIIDLPNNKLKFFCRYTFNKDYFYYLTIVNEKWYQREDHNLWCTWCGEINPRYFNSVCKNCFNFSFSSFINQFMPKYILIKEICLEVILPHDVINVIVNDIF